MSRLAGDGNFTQVGPANAAQLAGGAQEHGSDEPSAPRHQPAMIDHKKSLVSDLAELLKSGEHADVIFHVFPGTDGDGSEYKEYRAHRVILAARCDYFRALLYSEFQERQKIIRESSSASSIDLGKEGADNAIKICDIENVDTFHDILKYCYTGTVDLANRSESHIIDIMCTAHQFGINDLIQSIMHYLLENRKVAVYAALLNVAIYLQLDTLPELKDTISIICNFLDQKAAELLSTDSVFGQLSVPAIKMLLNRSSFYAREKVIFDSVVKWREGELGSQISDEEWKDVKRLIRFELMDAPDFFKIRGLNIVDPDILLDSLETNYHEQMTISRRSSIVAEASSGASTTTKSAVKGSRGVCIPNIDLATEEQGAIALQQYGECAFRLVKKNVNNPEARGDASNHPPPQTLDRAEIRAPPIASNYTVNFVSDINRGSVTNGSEARNSRLQGLAAHHSQSGFDTFSGQQCARHRILPDDVVSLSSVHSHTSSQSWGHQSVSGTHPMLHQHCLMLKLGNPSFVNMIRLNLWIDRGDMAANHWYSYRIESSIDGIVFKTVVDYEQYICQDIQTLYIPTTVMHYIKIVGTRSIQNHYFSVARIEVRYDDSAARNQLKSVNNVLIPTHNIARNAILRHGVTHDRQALFTNSNHYDWDNGYTCHQIGQGGSQSSILLQFRQPYYINSFRLRLWDLDTRCYSYNVEVSIDNETWETVANRTTIFNTRTRTEIVDGEEKVIEEKEKMLIVCHSWQTIQFEARPVCFVRIQGTRNTANEVFHLVYFEAPAVHPVGADQSQSAFNEPHRNVEYVTSRRANGPVEPAEVGSEDGSISTAPTQNTSILSSVASQVATTRHNSSETMVQEDHSADEDPIEIHRMKQELLAENLTDAQRKEMGMILLESQ